MQDVREAVNADSGVSAISSDIVRYSPIILPICVMTGR